MPEPQARQIREVLRLREGEKIGVLDNSGSEYRVELTHVGKDAVRGRVLEKDEVSREPRTQLILYQGLLKADKFEWVLQKCTELGVAEFVPVLTTRAVADAVGRAKRARWERILTEAAEQSGRGKIPTLHPTASFQEALQDAKSRGGLRLIPWEQERTTGLRQALSSSRPIQLFVGPEGGFGVEEIASARDYGAVPITLGPRILRAETAGLVAASAILYACGELERKQADG